MFVLPCRSLIVVFWAATFSHFQRLLFCFTAIQITSIPAANFQGWIWTWLDCCFTEWSNMITPRSVSWSVLTVSTWSIIVLNIAENNYLILAEILSWIIYNETFTITFLVWYWTYRNRGNISQQCIKHNPKVLKWCAFYLLKKYQSHRTQPEIWLLQFGWAQCGTRLCTVKQSPILLVYKAHLFEESISSIPISVPAMARKERCQKLSGRRCQGWNNLLNLCKRLGERVTTIGPLNGRCTKWPLIHYLLVWISMRTEDDREKIKGAA